jgi:hypothetical protein
MYYITSTLSQELFSPRNQQVGSVSSNRSIPAKNFMEVASSAFPDSAVTWPNDVNDEMTFL